MTTKIKSPGRRAIRDSLAGVPGSVFEQRARWRKARVARWERGETLRLKALEHQTFLSRPWIDAPRLEAMNAAHRDRADRWGMGLGYAK